MIKMKFRPRLTDRGWRLTVTALLLVLLGTFFEDALLLGAAALLAGLLLYRAIKLRADWVTAASGITFEPSNIEARLISGETFTSALTSHSTLRSKIRITAPLTGLTLNPDALEGSAKQMEVKFRPTYYGEYLLNHLEACIRDEYDLMEVKSPVPFAFKLSVYPKTSEAAAEAARFLAGEDIFSLGEEPTRFRGSGYEYADTRPYIRGDSLRSLDWKATARLNRLMVKENFIEGGVSVQIIFDGRAPDPVSHDELTEALVRSALSFARRGVKMGLTVVRVDNVEEFSNLQPFDAVALALNLAFEENRYAAEPVYALLDPQTGGKMRKILQDRVDFTPEVVSSINQGYEGKYMALEDETKRLVIYISSLQGDPLEILSLAAVLHAKRWDFTVIQPTKPWLHVDSLEEAKKLSDSYAKLYRVFDREGIEVEATSNSPNLNPQL